MTSNNLGVQPGSRYIIQIFRIIGVGCCNSDSIDWIYFNAFIRLSPIGKPFCYIKLDKLNFFDIIEASPNHQPTYR